MLIYTHDACLLHDTGPDHPECSARLQVVLDVLRRDHGDLEWREAPLAHLGDLKRVHAQPHIANVLEADFDGFRMLESDTVVVAASRAAALRAAGAGIAAVDALVAGEDITAFCAVRPPGHHATPDAAMGFCLFNNIAVAASHALATHALERVAIVDFDAHHGNGTQAIFWGEPRVGYFSSHEGGQFPYTGQPGERGCGNIRNVTLKANSGSASFRDAWIGELLPALDAFRPQLLLLSAGFDAHRCDPMADLMAETADFAWLTAELRALAEKHAGGRVVSMLEGGYDLDALRECVAVHVAALR